MARNPYGAIIGSRRTTSTRPLVPRVPVAPKPPRVPYSFNGSTTGPKTATGLPSTAAQTPGGPGATAPGASGTPSPNGLPVDPIYDNQIGTLGQQQGDTLAGLNTQQTGALASYGYTATGYDDQGNVTGLSFDPNNPYSQAAQLLTSFNNAKRGTGTSMAARGQLYSSAYGHAQDANTTGYNVGNDRLMKSLGAVLAGITQGRRTAGTNYELGAGQAYGDRIGRAEANPPGVNDGAAGPAPGQSLRDYIASIPQSKFVKNVRRTVVGGKHGKILTYGDGTQSPFIPD